MYAEDRTTIVDRREMLKVKIKSLAAEAKIIRHEERKQCGALRNELHLHRVWQVRSEARHTHLAYGLIRGLTIDQIEPRRITEPNMERVTTMLKKYGSVEMIKAIRAEEKKKDEPEQKTGFLASLFGKKAA